MLRSIRAAGDFTAELGLPLPDLLEARRVEGLPESVLVLWAVFFSSGG